ncbi:hypothetical protein [Oscillatoria salina]|nr:hypothetical protein [Oscillatoria salina]
MKKITTIAIALILVLGFAPQIIATSTTATSVCEDRNGNEHRCPQ